MKTNRQDARRREIEAAAYEVLIEKGYGATSMLAVAKRASASNETLYRWYGNKQALFRSLVEENAREVKNLLHRGIETGTDPLDTIRSIGPLLLALVTSDRAIALNRAAAGDAHQTTTLGKTIASAGKNSVAPLITAVFEQARAKNQLSFDDDDDVASVYIDVLIGDLQIQRVIGVRSVLEQGEIASRADLAYRLVVRLFGTAANP